MRYLSSHTAVIIASRNRPALLKRTLASLLDQSELPGQVIIVSASDLFHQVREAPLIADVQRRIPRCVYQSVTHKNKAYSLNQAVRLLADTIRIVAFTDDDCLLPRDWIAMHLANHAGKHTAGIITGRCISRQKSGFAQMYNEITVPPGEEIREFPFALGGNMSVKRRVVAGKWFDERYQYCEDYELAQRLAFRGFPTVLVPTLFVVTEYPEKPFPFLRRAFYHGWYEYRVNEAYRTYLKDLYTPGNRHPVLRTILFLPLLWWTLTAQYIRENRQKKRYPWYILFETAKVTGMLTSLFSYHFGGGFRSKAARVAIR
jgi:GT2 family glycosyltransferase